MPKKKIKKKEMSLSYVISLNKKKGMNLKAATKEAKIYMLGYICLYISFGKYNQKIDYL